MRAPILLALLASLIGCGSAGPPGNLLCAYCASDADCGGNPCFADASGKHFCGAPCDSCPLGFSCQPVQGSSGPVVKSCFPSNASCASTPVDHDGGVGGGGGGADGGGGGGGGGDGSVPVTCTTPKGGTVSIAGGTVDRLYFGYTGDTRDSSSTSSYSPQLQMIIDNIYTRMGQNGVSFALDGGDHMEASNFNDAQGNMASYASAAAKLGKPVFMTMGNHECSRSYNAGSSCGSPSLFNSDPKMSAYMAALQQISGATSPYYRFDVMTQSGKAVFLVVADDAWDDGHTPTTQQAWLEQQLTDADANAKYTFVSKHHPDGNGDQTYFQTIYSLVQSHKYTLFLTGHSHEYKHQWKDKRGVVMGLGGAPWNNPNQMWYGYLTVMQCSDDSITVTVIDQATGNMFDTFNVPPQ